MIENYSDEEILKVRKGLIAKIETHYFKHNLLITTEYECVFVSKAGDMTVFKKDLSECITKEYCEAVFLDQPTEYGWSRDIFSDLETFYNPKHFAELLLDLNNSLQFLTNEEILEKGLPS